MQFKVAFVFIFGVFLLTVGTNSARQLPLEGAFDSVIEIAEEILLGVSKAVTVAIEEVVLALREILQGLEVLEKGAVKLAEEAVQKEIEVIDKWIEELKNQSAGNATDAVLKCFQENEAKLTILQDEAVNTSLACIDDAIQKVGNDTLNLVYDIKLLNDEIAKEEKNLEACKAELIPIDCIKKVISNVVDLALSLPSRVQKDADKAQAEYDQLAETIQKCESQEVEEVKKEAIEIYQNITKCAG